MRLAIGLIVVLVAVGCGGSHSSGTDAGRADSGRRLDGGTDAAEPDGGEEADAGPDAGPGMDAGVDCSMAVEGNACTVEDAFCGGPCTDECSFCNILSCRDGTWQRMEVFPAPCFDCGPMERCSQIDEYCEEVLSGPAGGASTYSCRDAPAACTMGPNCACVMPPPEATCMDTAEGVIVRIAAP
jgi:hypothetical protein